MMLQHSWRAVEQFLCNISSCVPSDPVSPLLGIYFMDIPTEEFQDSCRNATIALPVIVKNAENNLKVPTQKSG